MSSAEHCKAAVQFFLFIANCCLHCFVGGRGMVGPCFVVHYLVSRFAIISLRKKDSWLLFLNCLLMSLDS